LTATGDRAHRHPSSTLKSYAETPPSIVAADLKKTPSPSQSRYPNQSILVENNLKSGTVWIRFGVSPHRGHCHQAGYLLPEIRD